MAPAPAPATSADALLCALTDDVRVDRETRMRIGWQLLSAERMAQASQDGWTIFGVTSFGQLCEERLNLPTAAGWQMRAAMGACECSSEVRKRLEDGRLNVAKAAAVAQVLDYVQQNGGEGALLALATRSTTRETRVEVSRLREEARTKESPVKVTLHLTRRAISDLWRARDLLTDGRGGPRPTESFAVERVLEFFVDRKCPERKAARAAERERRRSERDAGARDGECSESDESAKLAADMPTESAAATLAGGGAYCLPSAPGRDDERSRWIAARDRHEVVGRHGDVCWMEHCDERGVLQFTHDRAFRFGGSNEASNLGRWCLHHHRGFDSGRLKLRQGRDGLIVVDRRGQVVGRARSPPPP